MIKENEWDNPHHEVLFALFILEANHLFAHKYRHDSDYELTQVAMFAYYNIWEDRAVYEDKREFKVINRVYHDLEKEYRTVLTLSHKTPLGPVVYNGDTITIEVVK